MIEPRSFLVWACFVSGLSKKREEPSRPAQATVLFLVDGYSNAAIAREMQITAHQAARYVRESLAVLAAQEWTEVEADLFERMAARITEEESARDHFQVLLEAIRNSQDPTPRTVEYDANGRPIGGRSPLVDVDRAMSACVGIESHPAKMPRKLKLQGFCPHNGGGGSVSRLAAS